MARLFVYSTLTNNQKYTNYAPASENNLPQATHSVLIKGGANLSSGSKPHFITLRGVVTEITEHDYEELQKNFDFQKHVKAGFITVRPDNVHPEVAVAADMKQADQSAPLTPMSAELSKPENAAEGLTETRVAVNKAA